MWWAFGQVVRLSLFSEMRDAALNIIELTGLLIALWKVSKKCQNQRQEKFMGNESNEMPKICWKNK